MYAQAVRMRTFRRHSAKQSSAFEHVQKCTRGCSFSNEPCDCIKSIKLGESACVSALMIIRYILLEIILKNAKISIMSRI